MDYLSSSRPRDIFRRDVLCESQAGNSCFIITVTDECKSNYSKGIDRPSFLAVPVQKKKFVFITARIHPGETNSSYMVRGLLEFITSNDKIAQVREFASIIDVQRTRFSFCSDRNYDLS